MFLTISGKIKDESVHKELRMTESDLQRSWGFEVDLQGVTVTLSVCYLYSMY